MSSVFTATNALMVPIAGFLGDVRSRKRIIVISLFAWSLATLCTGFGSVLFYFIAVRGVASRISQLEKRFAPRMDEQGRRPTDVLRERLRRLAAAEGRELEEDQPQILVDFNNRPLTIREALRSRFRRSHAAPVETT